jgi:hypothetical protein
MPVFRFLAEILPPARSTVSTRQNTEPLSIADASPTLLLAVTLYYFAQT